MVPWREGVTLPIRLWGHLVRNDKLVLSLLAVVVGIASCPLLR